jgi:hypothetical protein
MKEPLPFPSQRQRWEPMFEAAERKAQTTRLPATALPFEGHLVAHLGEEHFLAIAKQERDKGHLRQRYLVPGLFSEGAWMILLDIFISDLQGDVVPIHGSEDRWELSEATAMRLVAGLIEANLLKRTAKAQQHQRTILSLSERARKVMRGILSYQH